MLLDFICCSIISQVVVYWYWESLDLCCYLHEKFKFLGAFSWRCRNLKKSCSISQIFDVFLFWNPWYADSCRFLLKFFTLHFILCFTLCFFCFFECYLHCSFGQILVLFLFWFLNSPSPWRFIKLSLMECRCFQLPCLHMLNALIWLLSEASYAGFITNYKRRISSIYHSTSQ